MRTEKVLLEPGEPLAIRVVDKGNKERLVPLSPLAKGFSWEQPVRAYLEVYRKALQA